MGTNVVELRTRYSLQRCDKKANFTQKFKENTSKYNYTSIYRHYPYLPNATSEEIINDQTLFIKINNTVFLFTLYVISIT